MQDLIDEAVIHRDGIPEFAVDMLNQLYGSLYCSLPVIQLVQAGNAAGISTYVRYRCRVRNEAPEILLMFRRRGPAIQVINEGMRLSRDDIDRFCADLFDAIPEANQIDFHAIALPATNETPTSLLTANCSVHARSAQYPALQWPCTEDIVIELPESQEHYLAQLGKSTRKSLKKSLLRAQRELPDFSHFLQSGASIREETIRDIVRFNHARMAQQQRSSALDDNATQQLIALMHSHGTAGLVMSGQRLCAGTLTCRFGDDIFSLVNAHDPAFDPLGLGKLSRHLMIMSAIKAGVRRFHLMGGNLAAKQDALGARQRLDHLTVYRSCGAVLRDLRGLLRHAADASLYGLHCWLEDRQALHRSGWPGRVGIRSVITLRGLRRQWLHWRESKRSVRQPGPAADHRHCAKRPG